MNEKTQERLQSLQQYALPAVGAALATAALSGCGGPTITNGDITKKSYVPANDWIYMQPIPNTICSTSAGVTSCNTTYTYIPVPMHDNEHWDITFKNCNVPKEDAGKCFKRTVSVPKSIFDQVQVGQTYDINKPVKR